MRRVLGTALLAAACLSLAACGDETPTTCSAAPGASATCTEACTKLMDLDCRVEMSVEACVTTCEAAAAGVDPAVTDRVRACYAQATSCEDVDGCSLTCGPGGGPVPFPVLDGGAMDASAPVDAGVMAVDAGVMAVDAGVMDDAGIPAIDAGAPATDGG